MHTVFNPPKQTKRLNAETFEIRIFQALNAGWLVQPLHEISLCLFVSVGWHGRQILRERGNAGVFVRPDDIRWDGDIPPHSVVVVLGGGDDISSTSTVDGILSAITSLVDRLHADGVVDVRLVEVPPRFKFRDPALTLRRNRGFRQVINRRLAAIGPVIRLDRRIRLRHVAKDGVHLSPEGMTLFFHILRSSIG